MQHSNNLTEFNQKMKGVAHDFANQVQENEADYKQFMKDLDAYHKEGQKLLKVGSFKDFVDEIRDLVDFNLFDRGESKEVKQDFQERFNQAFQEYQHQQRRNKGMQM